MATRTHESLNLLALQVLLSWHRIFDNKSAFAAIRWQCPLQVTHRVFPLLFYTPILSLHFQVGVKHLVVPLYNKCAANVQLIMVLTPDEMQSDVCCLVGKWTFMHPSSSDVSARCGGVQCRVEKPFPVVTIPFHRCRITAECAPNSHRHRCLHWAILS